MAADEEQPRKRKTGDRGVRKLLPGEEVEVLYSEEGLKGSWHFGVVIDCGKFFRTIELTNLLNEDNCSKLLDTVSVSAAIEGLSLNASKLHRNRMRPLPPKYKINATEIRYGVCVDAFVDDAWWEGVVFDHNEGSLERLIFFPDQGDQQVVSFEKLRITQEWNEASGQWKHRGKWPFLQVIQAFEQQGPLPVSVREIWYDLRSKTSLSGKIIVWNSGSKSMWRDLVEELIQELLFVVNGLQIEASIPYNELCENPMNIDVIDCPREFLPGPGGEFIQENAGIISGSAVTANTFPVLLVPNDQSSGHNTACENHDNCNFIHDVSQVQTSRKENWEHVLIMSCGNAPNNIQHPNSHLKQCDYDLKSGTVDGMHHDSHGNVPDGLKEIAQTNCLNSISVSNNLAGQNEGAESKGSASGITAFQSSETWNFMDIEAENCAESITLLLQYREDRDCELRRSKSYSENLSSLRLKAKRHLLALGWSIAAKKDNRNRVRLVSPNGRLYHSLRSACFGLLGSQPDKNEKQNLNNLKSLDGFRFGSSSSELLSMNSGGETDHCPHDNALDVLLPAMKKNKMDDSSHVIELNASNWETKTSTNFQSNCKQSSVMTESDVMSNSCVMNDKSSCDFTDERHINSGCSSSKKGDLVSNVSKRESLLYIDIEPEQSPGAVTQYIDYRNSTGIAAKKQSGVDANLITLNAKKHLLFMGWRIYKRISTFIYVSPIGKCFRSLYLACKAWLDEEDHGAGISRSLSNGKIRRRLEYLSREMKPVNIDNNLFRRVCPCTTTTDKKNSHEAFKVLQNGVEKEYTDSNKFAESVACSVPQMPSEGCRESRKRRKTSSACQYLDHKLLRHKACCSSACAKAERKKTSPGLVRKRHKLTSSSCRGRRSSKRSREVDALSSSQHVSRTILSLLIENDVLLPRQKVRYICKTDGHIMMEGRVTGQGIKCKCCSKVYSISNFENHAGSTLGRPSANIFLKDGRSLLQCQIQMASSKILVGFQRLRLKSDFSIYQSDSICSVCHDGGSLVLCDHCPSSFHLDCVGLEDVPEDKWFCPSCRCHICGRSDFNPDTEQFTDKTVLYCDQCEHEYHVECMRKRGFKSLQSCPSGNWFCSKSCSKIFLDLRKLVGISKPTSVEGLSCTILRSSRDYRADCDQFDSEVQAEHHCKLFVALKVLHECFVTIIEPRTQSDLVADILFNKESELKRLNFYGFYTMLLEKGDELVSVATFRIYGENIAEMPLVGTRVKYRRQGMCRLIVGELEKLLVSIGVERFVLPAVPQLLETWISSFGFAKMSNTDRLNLADYAVLNFQDTTMCQKVLRVAPPVSHSKQRDNSNNIICNIDIEISGQANLEPVLALPCFAAKSSPMFTATGNYDQTSHQTSCAHSTPNSNFVEPAGQAMWNEMKQTAVECVINCHSS